MEKDFTVEHTARLISQRKVHHHLAGRPANVPEQLVCPGDAVRRQQHVFQLAELRRRFANDLLLVSPLAGLLHVAYLLPRDSYGLGLYQEEPSILAPGCLELLADEIAARAGELP